MNANPADIAHLSAAMIAAYRATTYATVQKEGLGRQTFFLKIRARWAWRAGGSCGGGTARSGRHSMSKRHDPGAFRRRIPGFEGYSFPAQLEVDWKKSVKALSLSRSWTLVGFRFRV